METDFSITEYLGDSRAEMKCILKQRYSDFIVNEITPQRVVVEVCCDEESVSSEKETGTTIACSIDEDAKAPDGVSSQQVKDVDDILSDATKLVNISTEGMDKEARTKIHEWVRRRYHGKLSSQTRDGSIAISFSKNDNRKRKVWPEARPDYLHFTLSKENKDSHYALSLIAKFLGIKASNFGTCGTKDRRAITSQRVSVYRIDADRMRALNSRLRGMRLSDFQYCPQPCSLGQLWGNQFRIVLRCLNGCTDEEICARLEEFKSRGFINYFGTQRFGSCGVATAEVGLAILKRRYEEAVRTVLKQRPAMGCLRDALEEWNKSGNASLSIKKLSGAQAFASIEAQLLTSLAKSKDNFSAALMKLPRNTRSLYVHAYQSLVWNKAFASIEAQLLTSLAKSKDNFSAALMKLPRNTRSLYVHAYQSLVWNKVASRRIKEFGCGVIEGDIDVKGKKVEGDDISLVALPLPSSNMKLPENEVGKWYKEYMEVDGVTSDMFKSIESHYAIGDVLRELIVKPEDVEYQILKYSDKDTRLQPDLNGEYDKEKIGSGDLRALSLKFSLPSGCYATVALRQLTRIDMGKMAQSAGGEESNSGQEDSSAVA
ncbi:Putative pseudouridine synthase [Toxocara canis]|uniref:Putative pseudouridine synthase n=1 Tax=Toxocara canis TaxID=6265 RepID=A0A0B2VVJ4_TOXCA|nr:Putative pseudouridine synthase [Toxocara canis]